MTEAEKSAATDAGVQNNDNGAPQNPQSESRESGTGAPRRKRGGRRHNKARPAGDGAEAKPQAKASEAGQNKPAQTAPRRQNPALLQLQQLYPQLFGENPKPLKRGIFQDLEAAQPGVFAPADLKLALGIHTRSGRYLQAVSQGQPRHDLAGQVVEQMAPEHVFHALVEVFRRKKPREGEDLTQKLRRRMEIAFEASGLTREAYLELVRGRDEATNALLDEALAEVAARSAKDEALLRAYEMSGATSVEAFADMYGMQARQVAQQLDRARRLKSGA
nr:ProQ/FINO family protein [Diaphorobacter caeni]